MKEVTMKRLIILLTILWIPGHALAANVQKKVTATWTYDAATAAEDGVLGFRLKNASNQILADNIPVNHRSVTALVTSDGKACQSYYVTAFTADDETTPSNILTWCPPRRTLTGVGTFTIEVLDP